MKEYSISIKQRLVSQENDEAVVEVIIENNGSSDFENVSVLSQVVMQEFDVIKPQEVKTFSYSINIPSEEEVKKDFGEDAEIPEKLEIPPAILKCDDESLTLLSNSLVLIL